MQGTTYPILLKPFSIWKLDWVKSEPKVSGKLTLEKFSASKLFILRVGATLFGPLYMCLSRHEVSH